MATARWFEESDRPAVEAALGKTRDRLIAAGREWAGHCEKDNRTLLDGILELTSAVIIGDYFLAFQISGSWFTDDAQMFQEVIVLRISQHTGNTLRSVVQEMERIARLNDCVGIHVGTYGAMDDKLGRVYQKLGFRKEPVQLYKEF